MYFCPFFRLALTALVLIGPGLVPAFAQQRPAATGTPTGPGGADPSLFRAPVLDPLSLVMAYNRLNGTVPDFRPYAERSSAYVNASAFDRSAVMAREMARLEGQFASLDLNRVYAMRINTQLHQYDSARRGYALGFTPDTFVPIGDPVTGRRYDLQFRNLDEVGFLPVGDAVAARNFAQSHAFNTQYDNAGLVILDFVIRFAEAPPEVSGGSTVIRADIVAGRIITPSGQPVWDFGRTAAGAVPAPAALVPGVLPLLKAADIQGISVGMPAEEGAGIASRAYPTERWHNPQGGRWFRAIDPGAEPTGFVPNRAQAVRCGLDPLSGYDASMRAQMDGRTGDDPVADASQACLGYDVLAADGSATTGTITSVTSGQRLPGATLDSVRQAMVEKYGSPTYTREGGRLLQWVGRDPLHPDAAPVSLIARLGTERPGSVALGIKAQPYTAPGSSQATQSQAAPAAPHL